MEKIRIILSGACGRLCSVIASLAEGRDDCEIIGGVDVLPKDAPYPIVKTFDELDALGVKGDVIIDCSHHTTVGALTEYAKKTSTPAVICTTGHTDDEEIIIKKASEVIPILKSRNMSLGINLLSELVKKAASVLGADFDIEIVEAHHHNKLDAPSGTALMLADAAREARDEGGLETEYVYERQSVRHAREPKEIGISAIRGGTIVGDHSVIFAGSNEVITLSHRAESRDLFATGAIRAALHLAGKPAGFYTMADVIGDALK